MKFRDWVVFFGLGCFTLLVCIYSWITKDYGTVLLMLYLGMITMAMSVAIRKLDMII